MRPISRVFILFSALCLTVGETFAEAVSAAQPAAPPQLRKIAGDDRLQLTMGQPTVVMNNGGYQPYLFATSKGTLFCQAQIEAKPFGTKNKMVYPNHRIGTALSRDLGITWQPWTHEAGHDDVFIEGGAVECADGTLFLLDTFIMPSPKSGYGIGEVWKSKDDLRSLQGPVDADFHLPKIQFGGTDDIPGLQRNYARLHRSLIEMPNGDLLALVYSQFAGDTAPSAYLVTMFKSRNVLVRSTDRGVTWSYLATIGVDGGVGTEGFDEGTLVRVGTGPHTGRLLTLFRTGRELYGSHSDDDGATWVRPKPVLLPGIDVYDTVKWEHFFVDTKAPDYMPTDEMIGALVDPDLIQMQNGTLACAVGFRAPARKSIFDNWRAPQNGNYLVFSLDGGDNWSHVVQYTSGAPTTHYAGVREVAKDLLYVVYDNSIWYRHNKVETEHDTMGFQLTVKRTDSMSVGK
jgi:hypothetical protein